MRRLCEELKGHVNEVIALWETLAESEPWVLLPQHERVDDLPEVVKAIAETALCTRGASAALRGLVDISVVHGLHRASQGVADQVIPTEYDLLRRAIWLFFRQRVTGKRFDDQKDVAAILRVDAAIAVATRAAVIGYHRAQLESLGRWPSAIESLMDESPLGWITTEEEEQEEDSRDRASASS